MSVIFKPFSLGFKILQRVLVFRYGTPELLRTAIYNAIIFVIRLQHPKLSKKFDTTALANLHKSGFSYLPSLSKSDLLTIKEEIIALPAKKLKNKDGAVRKEYYESADLAGCSAVMKFSTDPDTYNLVSSYLQAPAVIQYLTAWQTFGDVPALPEMHFHMDHHGHRFLKLFVYLSDVEEGDGHHEYIRNTHRWRRLKSSSLIKKNPNFAIQIKTKRRFKSNFWTNSEAISRACGERIEKVTGKAGCVFIEDTSGLHRGTKVKTSKPRLVLQVLYTPFDSGKDDVMKSDKNWIRKECEGVSPLSHKQLQTLLGRIYIDY